MGLDRGDHMTNWSPDEALPALTKEDRTPLLLTEGVHWVLQQPEALERNRCFMTIGSRLRKADGSLDARTPAIWISNGTGRDGRERRNAPKVAQVLVEQPAHLARLRLHDGPRGLVPRASARGNAPGRPRWAGTAGAAAPGDVKNRARPTERQNLGRGACSSTILAASASVSTDGGEPARGLLAVSFMHRTAMTPMTAAPVE
ncbi:hypothetical protein SGRIM119S_07617 [Streptomyces griseorubiginosus]